MKKILLSLVVAAAALFATSCANELDENIKGNGNGVTFEISTPELASRADFGTGAEATKLLYAVYDETAGGTIVEALSAKALDSVNAINIPAGGSTSFALDLLDGNEYSVLFWAVSADYADAFEIQWAEKAMQMKTGITGNDESFDAFFGYIETFEVEGAVTKSATLTRPFAQLNIGTNDFQKAEDANFDTDAISSKVVIEGVPTVLNCVNGTVGTPAAITYGSTPMAAGYTFPVSGYDYLAMNYVLVGEKQVYNATLTVTDGTKTIENTYNNIPLARNYKTNVYGELLVNGSTFNVEIDETWKTPNDDNNIVETGYQFVLALLRGENVILANDITVTAADIQAALNTPAPVMSRAATSEAINVVINLGGYTITFEDGAALDLNDGSVTIEGEGAIVAGEDDGFIGDVFTAEDSEVDTKGYEGTVFTAAGLVEAFKTGSEYTVGTDIALTEPLKLAAGKEFTLKFKNNAVLSIVDTATGSFALITNQGKLTIEGEGKLTIEAINNRGWNAYSSVLSNTVGGELTVKGVEIEHLGGTDMAYGIDNLTNGKGTVAVTTIDGATVKSPYRAVRMFLNGIEATNELYVKAGVIEGGNKSIWMQDPSAKANTGKLVVEAAAELKGDVYLFVTAGSTEWPVEVSIAKAALVGDSEVLTGNVPEGYKLAESETEYYVAKAVVKIGETAYFSLQEAFNAAEAGDVIVLTEDITITKPATVTGKDVVLDLNGKTISGTMHKNVGSVIKVEAGATLNISNGTISSTVNNGGSAIANAGTAVLENVTLNGAPNADGSWPSYTVNNTGTLTITNSTITSHHGAVASYNDNALITLNNTNIDMSGIPGFTSHGIYTYNNGKVEVNGGNIANKATDQASSGASVINGAVTVNAGTFSGRIENYYGTPVLKGGSYTVKPNNKFIAEGYKAAEANDKWVVVANEVVVVSTGAALNEALANADVDVVVLNVVADIEIGKIDLTNNVTKDVVIDANGHKITTTDAYGVEITAGKNVTIKNANIVMTKKGDYITYAAGVKIANGDYAGNTVKLENCKVTMANNDWAYGVTMPASVKNLTLNIDDCEIEGAIAVQCWGDNNTITINRSDLICNYTTNAQYTSYCVVLQDDGAYAAENNNLAIDGCEFSYTGVNNFNSVIYSVKDVGSKNNTVTVINSTYNNGVAAYGL